MECPSAGRFEQCNRNGNVMVKEKRATLEEILTTFSSHISKSYPSPGEFQERLHLLLENKKEGKVDDAYAKSLENNIVFLHDLVTEARALLDLLLRPDKEPKRNLDAILEEMEGKVKAQTKKRYAAVFDRGEDEEFQELARMKRKKSAGYIEKLEFNYLYLMTLRLLLFEFFNVLESIKAGYKLARMKPDSSKKVTDSLALTAHFYLGNVQVEGKYESSEDGGKPDLKEKAPPSGGKTEKEPSGDNG
jgi:hypothetical protein